MKKALKWHPKEHKYHEYELPAGSSAFEKDMEKMIACAQCGKQMPYGLGYTSRQIHTPGGFGYLVCEQCYSKEWKEERDADK